MTTGVPNEHASSTGQAFTDADWLDDHFEASRPEYEAMFRSVGFQPGWHVLDAGCGTGGFLPLIADAVGASGRIVALDLAPDNIAIVERRASTWGYATPIEGRVGTLTALPDTDDAFDGIWCANTTQYLTDADLATALTEFRRVVRPGGIVAIKEWDGTLCSVVPAPPLFLQHVCEAAGAKISGLGGVMRTPALAGWLRRAGLVAVEQHRVLAERSAPLGPVERQLWGDWLAHCAALVPELDVPAADRVLWEQIADPAGLDRLLDDPDLNYCEGHIIVVGTVP